MANKLAHMYSSFENHITVLCDEHINRYNFSIARVMLFYIFLPPAPYQSSLINIFFSYLFLIYITAVPSAVPMMHQVSRTAKSITLSWPQPDQPNGVILDYQLRYFNKVCYG